MPDVKLKAFAYVTHRHPTDGHRLLVFSHPNAPGAGIQVPAGTMRPDESPAEAALREAVEETGLTDLELVGCLGEPPAVWRNHEPDPDDGAPDLPLFELFWAPLPGGIPDVIADHGVMLPALLARLTARDGVDG